MLTWNAETRMACVKMLCWFYFAKERGKLKDFISSQLAESCKMSVQRIGDTFVTYSQKKAFGRNKQQKWENIEMTVFCRLKKISEDWHWISEKVLTTSNKIFFLKSNVLKKKDEVLIHYSAFNLEILPFWLCGGKNKRQFLVFWVAMLDLDVGFFGFRGQICEHDMLWSSNKSKRETFWKNMAIFN